MSYLRYFCLFAHHSSSSVQHILCCVFVLFYFVLCVLCCKFLRFVHFGLPLRYLYNIVVLAMIIIIIMLTVICRQNILRTITIKEVLILVTNILDQIVLKV